MEKKRFWTVGIIMMFMGSAIVYRHFLVKESTVHFQTNMIAAQHFYRVMAAKPSNIPTVKSTIKTTTIKTTTIKTTKKPIAVKKKIVRKPKVFHPFNMKESKLPMEDVPKDFYKKIKLPSMSLIIRMPGSVPKFTTRFYCDVFRTVVLFWNPDFGKLVVVLDEESKKDHEFGDKLLSQTKDLKQKVEVKYEPLPKKTSTLAGKVRSPQYSRQLWSSFFLDLYTQDEILAWMDTDSAIGTPVTSYDILKDGKIKAIGQDRFPLSWVRDWDACTQKALGLTMPSDFMLFFPVFLWRSTVTNCRNFILKRFKTNNFEDAFSQFYIRGKLMSPIDVIMTYAWYLEHDKYEWHLDVNNDKDEINDRLPTGHKIKEEDTTAEVATGYHTGYYFDVDSIKRGYCLSHYVTGKKLPGCEPFYATSGVSLYNLGVTTTNGFCDTPKKQQYCKLLLARHYRYVQEEFMTARTNPIDVTLMQKVENFAKDAKFSCARYRTCVQYFGKC